MMAIRDKGRVVFLARWFEEILKNICRYLGGSILALQIESHFVPRSRSVGDIALPEPGETGLFV
jgi:ABC-type uncharacterized transport system permease subunit